jgi:hypothetical protein
MYCDTKKNNNDSHINDYRKNNTNSNSNNEKNCEMCKEYKQDHMLLMTVSY